MIQEDFLDSSLRVNSRVEEASIQLWDVTLSRINFKWPGKYFVAYLLNNLFV